MKTLYCVGCGTVVAKVEAGSVLLQHISIRCGTCENRNKRAMANAKADAVDEMLSGMSDTKKEPNLKSDDFGDIFKDFFGKGGMFNSKY